MTNIERLKLEIAGIEYTDTELGIFLAENGLVATDEYNVNVAENKRKIIKTALTILNAIANNPMLMKKYKTDEITILEFSDNLNARIEALENQLKKTLDTDSTTYVDGATFVYMFNY